MESRMTVIDALQSSLTDMMGSVYRGQKAQAPSRKRGVVSPHKSLLLMLHIRRGLDQGARLIDFAEEEEVLSDLLRRFGSGREAQHPEYPFVRLRNQREFWELEGEEVLPYGPGDDVSAVYLRDMHIRAGFREPYYSTLRSPDAAGKIVRFLLRETFTEPATRFAAAEATGLAECLFE
jgi:hypothetical protein